MSDMAENYIKLINTVSVDRLTEITEHAAWDEGITNQEYCEIVKYVVNKLRSWEANENE